MTGVKLIILRQASTGEWQPMEARAWSAAGEWVDPSAGIATLWRYSAITTFTGSANLLDAGSDAAEPRELDYTSSIYGFLGYRNPLSEYSWAPPGHDLTGAAPHDDWFSTVAHSFDGQSPSFIPTNPAMPGNQDAPLTFTKEGTRYFGVPEPSGNYTELSTGGYVIRGRPFSIQAEARISGSFGYEGCLLGFPPVAYLVQPEGAGTLGTGEGKKTIYKLRATQIEVPGTRFEAPEEKGFDGATYFASQHLPGGVSAADGTRRVSLRNRATPSITKQGPFTMSQPNPVATGVEMDLQANSDELDETGKVHESRGDRELKVVTLPPRNWTVGLYPVDIHNVLTDERHVGPEPPDAAGLQAALNEIYGKQANVTFNVAVMYRIVLTTADLSPPYIHYPLSVSEMKAALWANSDQEDLVLFWVPEMESGTLGQAFGIPSRGAVLGPTADAYAVAHEIGHCFGLFHCWQPDGVSSLAKIADRESKRVMGYSHGKLLRSKEIVKINQTDFDGVLPLGSTTSP